MQKSVEKKRRIKASEPLYPPLLRTVQQAFQLKRNPLPWSKAITAGICSGIPVLIGLLANHLSYGMLAGIGSFTYLYVANIPYSQRAKKLFFVMIGLAMAVGLGTLVAPHPLTSAIFVGLIGALVTFLFGAYKIHGPAAIFFVLAFSLATGMPIDPTSAPLRAGLVLCGGALAWLLGMIGWVRDPHGPQTTAMKRVYMELAAFMDRIGSGGVQEGRKKLVAVLKSAEESLAVGQTPRHSSGQYQRLLLLNDQANAIFLDVLEYAEKKRDKLPPQFGKTVRSIAAALDEKNKGSERAIRAEEWPGGEGIIPRLQSHVREAVRILIDPQTAVDAVQKRKRQSLWTVLGGSFDKNSIVFLTSIRFGLVLAATALLAYSFELNRSYWVTLSCAAVMSGATIIATFHRAIQRSIGTVVGIMVATIILAAHPHGLFIAVVIMFMTALTELAIVLNYGLAALFITPNALLLAESTGQNLSLSFVASARIIDVVIGCAIGLVGTLLIGRRKASSMLPHLIAKTIRSQQQYLMTLFSEHRANLDLKQSLGQRKMQTNLSNLQIVYTTAIGEIPSNKRQLEYMWPVIFSIEQVGYLLESCLKSARCPILSDATLSQLLLVFETMAKSAEQKAPLAKKEIPAIIDFPQLQRELSELQDALQVSTRVQASEALR